MKPFTSIFDLGKILDPRKSTSTAWYLEVRKIGGQAVLNKAYVINTLHLLLSNVLYSFRQLLLASMF